MQLQKKHKKSNIKINTESYIHSMDGYKMNNMNKNSQCK